MIYESNFNFESYIERTSDVNVIQKILVFFFRSMFLPMQGELEAASRYSAQYFQCKDRSTNQHSSRSTDTGTFTLPVSRLHSTTRTTDAVSTSVLSISRRTSSYQCRTCAPAFKDHRASYDPSVCARARHPLVKACQYPHTRPRTPTSSGHHEWV